MEIAQNARRMGQSLAIGVRVRYSVSRSLESAAPVSDVSICTERRVMLILPLWFVAVALAVGVRRDIPVIDDWTYAWSVERLFADRRFEVLDWSAVYRLGRGSCGRMESTCGSTCPALRSRSRADKRPGNRDRETLRGAAANQ
jgi:hypothetical protein